MKKLLIFCKAFLSCGIIKLKFSHYKTYTLIASLCIFLFTACPTPHTLTNARFKKEFLRVYEEKDFSFKTAGTVQGSFTLPKNVKHKGLYFGAMFPATFRKNKRSNNQWDAVVKIPYKITLTWNGGSLKKEDAEAKSDWFGLNIYFSEEDRCKLPVKKEITYTLEYETGVYTKLLDMANRDKLTDLQDHPEKYLGFYDAVLVVAEKSTKKTP